MNHTSGAAVGDVLVEEPAGVALSTTDIGRDVEGAPEAGEEVILFVLASAARGHVL